MPQISVIIPVYNVEKYLHRCIDSILDQTYRDIEIIIVDDGSTDQSGIICDKYIKIDNRIQVFHKENEGQSSARNLGVEKSNTDWLCFIDSDDYVHPQMLEFLKRGIDDNKTLMSICSFKKVDDNSNIMMKNEQYSSTIVEVNEESLLNNKYIKYTRPDTLWVVCAKLINKKIVIKYPFDNGRIYEDNAITIKWVYESKNISFIDYEFYYYYSNQGSTTQRKLTRKHADLLWAYEEQLLFLQKICYHKLAEIKYENLLSSSLKLYKRYIIENNDKYFARKISRYNRKYYV